ncbi:MAG TPA: serine/threonine-protein kinase [Ktedonobacterales bacterium]|jgi:serine/threonine protein kinase
MPTTEELLGTMLGHYRLEKVLSKQSMVALYLATDTELDRRVAMKVLLPWSIPKATQSAFIDRFRNEARLTATLDHPNILPAYAFTAQNDLAYLVMHYAPNGSLHDRISAAKGGNPLTLDEAAYYLEQAAAALDYTHKRGIIHCDVRPQHLYLKERWLMLGGFGSARQAAEMSGSGPSGQATRLLFSMPNDPLYLAPEQAQGTAVSKLADIYALGMTLHQLVILNSPISKTVEEVVNKAIAARPTDRYQSAGELAAAFRTAITAPAAAPATNTSPKLGEKQTRVPTSQLDIPIICHQCGFLNKPQAKFCRNDGVRLPILCPRCFTQNRPQAKFCFIDGAELVRTCPKCGLENPANAQICQRDQVELVRICPICRYENPLRARFCERDGAPLMAGR